MKESDQDFRSFEILTIGSYQSDIGDTQNEFDGLIVSAYGGEKLNNSPLLDVKLIHI